jgi:hypothetical protein
MPDWAPLACDRWRAVLDRLAAGATDAVDCTEWALKHRIMTDHIHRYGLDWESLHRFNKIAEQAMSFPEVAEEGMDDRGKDGWDGGRLAARITTEARRHGYRRENVQRVLELRENLCELDMRFAMAPGGIHEALEPLITNHVPEVTEDRIRHAMTWPPDDTRAAVRGRYIRRLSAEHDRYSASWVAITDLQKRLRLDLSDPFCRRARWKGGRSTLRVRLLPGGETVPPLEMD